MAQHRMLLELHGARERNAILAALTLPASLAAVDPRTTYHTIACGRAPGLMPDAPLNPEEVRTLATRIHSGSRPQVLLEERNTYGMHRYYPFNDAARRFCDLLGMTTLPPQHIDTIKALGFEVRTVGRMERVL